ncbi:MAG: XRE family transcriptional regulator [Geminicoccaceae bacterium]|nr:MAG: XRE family transcriptional regulator [Geminicoccaceae bacterium]
MTGSVRAQIELSPSSGGRARAVDVDRYVSLRIRQRRIMLGLTQQQLAELIGVTYQQAHKYETGINRISAGRLYQIAQALGVDIAYFYDEVVQQEGPTAKSELLPQQRMLLELARNFAAISNRKHQEALCGLARALVNNDGAGAERSVS